MTRIIGAAALRNPDRVVLDARKHAASGAKGREIAAVDSDAGLRVFGDAARMHGCLTCSQLGGAGWAPCQVSRCVHPSNRFSVVTLV